MCSGSFIVMSQVVLLVCDGLYVMVCVVNFMYCVFDDFYVEFDVNLQCVWLCFVYCNNGVMFVMFMYVIYFIIVYGFICWLIGWCILLLYVSFCCDMLLVDYEYLLMFCDDMCFNEFELYVDFDFEFVMLLVVQNVKMLKMFLCNVLVSFIVKYCNLNVFVQCVCVVLCGMLFVVWLGVGGMVVWLYVVEVMLCCKLYQEGYVYQLIKDMLWCDFVFEVLVDFVCMIVDVVVVIGFVELSVFYCVFCKWSGCSLVEFWEEVFVCGGGVG